MYEILTLSFSSNHIGLSEVMVTASSNGKKVSSRFMVEVKVPTGTDLFKNDEQLRVFPNPSNGIIKVVMNQDPPIESELIVTDIKGKIILKRTIKEKEEWVDLRGYTPGMYLVKTNSDNSDVQKVILK